MRFLLILKLIEFLPSQKPNKLKLHIEPQWWQMNSVNSKKAKICVLLASKDFLPPEIKKQTFLQTRDVFVIIFYTQFKLIWVLMLRAIYHQIIFVLLHSNLRNVDVFLRKFYQWRLFSPKKSIFHSWIDVKPEKCCFSFQLSLKTVLNFGYVLKLSEQF